MKGSHSICRSHEVTDIIFGPSKTYRLV